MSKCAIRILRQKVDIMLSETGTAWVKQLTALPEMPNEWCQFWLVDVNKMTQTLQHHFGSITINVFDESWSRPFPFEKEELNTLTDELWVRTSVLQSTNRALVFARAAITPSALNAWPQLKSLGNNSLGKTLLHNQDAIKRSEFHFAEFKPNDPMITQITDDISKTSTILGRYSLFYDSQQPLICLTEVLLPGLANQS